MSLCSRCRRSVYSQYYFCIEKDRKLYMTQLQWSFTLVRKRVADVITTIFEIHWSASVVSHNLVGFALQVSSMWEQLPILVHWVVKWRMPLLRVSPFLQHYSETCPNDHSHIATTCVHRPECYVPTKSPLKAVLH